MNGGIGYNFKNLDYISNADGEGGAGGGGMWGAIATAVGTIFNSGFQFGAVKDTNKAQTEQARLLANSSVLSAGYQSLGQDTSSELLAAALGQSVNKGYQQPVQESAFSKNIVWLGLIAAVALVAVIVIYKSDMK